MSSSTFDTTKLPLQDLLKDIQSGKMQLPDFQRGWIWDDERIRSLIASIAVSFPIGAVMLLETGGNGAQFKPRAVEGVSVDPQKKPEILILDGQQRFTSLFQALMLQAPVKTTTIQKKKIERYYYFDMREMTNGHVDEEEAILSIPHDRQVRSDFGRKIELDVSTAELEYENHLFPVNRVFHSADWRTGYQEYWSYEPDKMKLYNAFESQVIKRFEQYQIPIIKLLNSTPKEAVCLVFEKVNTGGVALTVFELLTATFAADNFQLREDWDRRQAHLKNAFPVLRSLQSDDFLQAVSLLVTWTRRQEAIARGETSDNLPGIGCKRRDILRLTVEDYKRWADDVEKGFEQAAKFLHAQHIFKYGDLPYRTQVVPLAAAHVALGHRAETVNAQNQMARWYWCGVLGELYGGAVESRMARDLPEIVALVRGEAGEPKTVQDANFDANRLLSLRTRNSAAYKGIHALLMRSGCQDFRSGKTIGTQTFFDENIDIHHIFPKSWCQKRNIQPAIYNSIINKTAISARTNRIIGGQAPSSYLARIEEEATGGRQELLEILESHLIDPGSLYADDFDGFFSRRAAALVTLIEGAMGKPVAQEGADFLNPTESDEFDDEIPEWEIESAPAWEDEVTDAEMASPDDNSHAAVELNGQDTVGEETEPTHADLEGQFHQAMLDLYQSAKKDINDSANYFLQMVLDYGGLETARRLLAKADPSDGFVELYFLDRLDLTVEAQAIKPEYRPLFTDEELAVARQRLADLNYQFDA